MWMKRFLWRLSKNAWNQAVKPNLPALIVEIYVVVVQPARFGLALAASSASSDTIMNECFFLSVDKLFK